ncbi:echinoderm microtubule-associated protein-like 2 isoform X1 [Dermacentor andersoni]|uniref:echinoderm microtubule-associated protein-like 2 isoform X1 n=2 Tax=Dermacentor andersoni TaxID=34620 RepID=UPI00215523CE|nr:echinoderm microtubule-associated protein-like 2 isoform X1 [Dermacentor andersoni]
MRINGHKEVRFQDTCDEGGGSQEQTTHEEEDMLNHDELSLQERVSDLEKKSLEQADEITCLRSTIADLLRRINQLEGRAPVITNSNSHATTPTKVSPSLPQHPAAVQNRHTYHRQASNSSTSSYTDGVTPHNGNHHPTHTSPGVAPQRRLSYFPTASTSSLHSEGGQSSTSASPVPSPAPSSYRSSPSPRQTPSPNRHISASTSNLSAMRRWSSSCSSQDFATGNRRIVSGSMYNLPMRSSSGTLYRHGTREAQLNTEDGTVRMYLRGRPIVMHIPSEQLHDYSLMKVNSAPSQRLKLEWVYGYRGRDCRANLFLLPTGEMVYFIAAVVVLYNVEEQIQRHYLGHTDDIKCLAVHPNKLLIATGQVASIDRRERKHIGAHSTCGPCACSLFQPHVRIWDSVSLNTLHVIGVGDFERAVSCIAFSKMDGGSILCAVDDSSEHTISLWDWQRGEKGVKITETKSASDTVLSVEFHPMDRHTLVTLGKGHIHFWDMEGGTLAKKLGLFERDSPGSGDSAVTSKYLVKSNKPKYVLCMTFTELGELLTGDSNGNIMVWQRGSNKVCRTVVGAHDGPLFSICAMKDGTIVTGGAKDRKVVQWDSSLTRTGQEAKLPDMAGGIRTLAQGKGSMLLIGTTRNSILQGTFSLNFSTVVQGHTEEIWALAVHPTQNQFVTGGYDCQVHLWDTLSHSVVWSRDLGEQAQAACFSPDGSVLVLTTRTGRWSVIDSSTRQLYSMHSDGTEPIDAVAFSPNGQLLALGSRDSFIYVYQVSEEGRKYNRISRCSGHSSFVIHLDWAVDSTYLRSCSGDYEILYWNALVCRQVTNMSITRDLKWHTQTCTIGFSVYGIWPENADGTDINTCSRSHSGRLLATGDDFGKVRVFSYPASQPKCLSHMYGGHSSHVTAVDFLPDDNRLISLGGRDCAVLQWAVV